MIDWRLCVVFFSVLTTCYCVSSGGENTTKQIKDGRGAVRCHTHDGRQLGNAASSQRSDVYIHTHTHTQYHFWGWVGGLKISLSLSLLSNQSSSGDECTTSVVRTHFRGIHPQTLLIITCMYTHNTRRGYPAHVSDRMTTVCVCVCSSVLKKPRKFGRVFTRFRFSQYSTELGNKGEFQTSLVRAEKSHTVLMMYITGN